MEYWRKVKFITFPEIERIMRLVKWIEFIYEELLIDTMNIYEYIHNMNYRKDTNPLKRRRISLGITQKQISEFLNVTQSQYSKIESGESDPTKHLNTII